jgi:hypothetical protein
MLLKFVKYLFRFGPIKTIKKIKDVLLGSYKKDTQKEKLPEFIDDPDVIELFRMKSTLAYLKNNYLPKISSIPTSNIYNPIRTLEKPVIWICWQLGYDNAPDIVKACIKSVKEHSNGYDVILITEENMDNYIYIPEYAKKKVHDGTFSRTHFSELIRILLIINYGGVWLDATVFLTNDIPEFILNSELFMFKTSILEYEFLPASSWFIAAKKNNPILIKLIKLLFLYWENENTLLHYYIFHISLLLLLKYDDESKELWKKILYKNNSDPHVLQFRLFDDYSDAMKKHIWQISFAHKLSHYFHYFENYEMLLKKEGTFYQYILNTLKE